MNADVRIGVVGLGRLGWRHAHTLQFRTPGARVVSVCSVDAAEVRSTCDELPGVRGYENYGEMLAAGGMDAVVIATSSHLHASQIADALDAGYHVFSEKPLGTTLDQCRAAERAVEAHPDRRFMLGFMRRYDESYAAAKRMVNKGTIGEPFLVRAYGLDPERFIDGAIRFAATSGGIFLDMMIHDIDLARWFLQRDAVMVHAVGGTFKYPQFAEHDDVDNAAALMQFTDDKMALFYTGRTAPHGYHIETEIVGTEGSIRIDGMPRSGRAVVYTTEGMKEPAVQSFPERFGPAFEQEFAEFLRCIHEGRDPEVTVYDGTKATVIASAATESLRTGRPIEITY